MAKRLILLLLVLGVAEAQQTAAKQLQQNKAPAQQSLEKLFRLAANGDKSALQKLRARSEQGDAAAPYYLGSLCELGTGVPKDGAQAVAWYQKAADRGFAKAAFQLGSLYGAGDIVLKDDSQSEAWDRRAAELGYVDAQLRLGKLYALRGLRKRGQEIARSEGKEQSMNDLIKAYTWFNLAAAQGNADAQYQRENIERQMTSDEIAVAQRLSRGWRPKR